MWTRRDLLRAVGASTALAAMSPWGCGGAGGPEVAHASYDPERLRDALRSAVVALGARLTAPFAFASVRQRLRTTVELEQRGQTAERRAVVLVGGRDRDGRWHERGTSDLSPAGVARVADELAAVGSVGGGAAIALGRASEHVELARDPRALSRRWWQAEADGLADRIAARATSRIVYRATWMVDLDEESWMVAAGRDHHQRRVRGQVGATVIAWHGGRPIAGDAIVDGPRVLSAATLTDAMLDRALADALTLYTPGGAPTGAATLVLAPALVAAIMDRVLATPTVAARLTPASALAIVDDPGAAEAIAGYAVDDDGQPARATTVLAGGRFAADLAAGAGGARRGGPHWRWSRGPTHLMVSAGERSAAQLEAAVDAGLALEGARDVRLDPDGRLVVRAARTRELARGQRTGRVWGDLELRADVGALLAAVEGLSQERVTLLLDGDAERDDDAPPRSATVPTVVTRGEVGGPPGDPT